VKQREKHLENGGGGTEELMGCEIWVRTQKFGSTPSALRKGQWCALWGSTNPSSAAEATQIAESI